MTDERTKGAATDEYLQQLSRQIDRLEGLKVNHSHSFNVTYSRSYLVQVTIVELFLFRWCITHGSPKRGWRLKYRYVLMSGNADAKTLDRLENCFEWNRDREANMEDQEEVEDFERWTEKESGRNAAC